MRDLSVSVAGGSGEPAGRRCGVAASVKLLGVEGAADARDVLRVLRGLRARHEAVRALIAALEACRASGVDLRSLWCSGCPAAKRRAA